MSLLDREKLIALINEVVVSGKQLSHMIDKLLLTRNNKK